MAMLVVLGAIVLFSVLGYVGITMAQRFVEKSGSLVDLRSQRIASTAGLNLAVAAMQSNPAATAALLQEYWNDKTKSWIQFPASSSGVPSLATSEPQWATLGSDSSGCRVRILGMTDPATGAGVVDVRLESYGMGRSGDVFRTQATYRIFGLSVNTGVSTNGPSNALQSQGGIDFMNVKDSVAGGVYSGGTGTTTLQASGTTRISAIRTPGSIHLNSPITVDSNSVIGGNLSSNGSGSLIASQSLIIRGGIQTMTGSLSVGRSLVILGTNQTSTAIDKSISVGDSLYVAKNFAIAANLTVGRWACFNNGLTIGKGTTSITGNLYCGSSVSNSVGFGNNGTTTVNITGNLYVGTSGLNLLNNSTTTVTGNAQLARTLRVQDGSGKFYVMGQSYLGNGIRGGTVSGNDSIYLAGESYISRTFSGPSKTNTFLNGRVCFGSSVIIDKNIDPAFGTTGKKWTFLSSGNPRKVTYTGGPASLQIENTLDSNKLTSVVAPTWGWLNPTFPDEPTSTSLGFAAGTTSAADLDTSRNRLSVIQWDNLPAATKTHAAWATIKTTYTGCATGSDAPPAPTIDCIYLAAKAAGKLYNGFLILDIDSWLFNSGVVKNSRISKDTKVFFRFANGPSELYGGEPGSVQIVYGLNASTLTYTQDFYGFIQLASTGTVIVEPSATTPTIHGAFETSGGVRTQSNSIRVTKLSTQAGSVISAISTAFSVADTKDKAVIRFSGDKDKGAIAPANILTSTDGWVQFKRLAEFR
jgi:hypothetical protein